MCPEPEKPLMLTNEEKCEDIGINIPWCDHCCLTTGYIRRVYMCRYIVDILTRPRPVTGPHNGTVLAMSTITSGRTMGQAFNLMASRYLVKEYSVGASCAAAHCLMLGSLDHGSQHKFTPTLRTATISNVSPRAAVAGGDNCRPTFQTILKVLAVLRWSPSRPSSINSLRRFSLQCKLREI